MPKALCDMTLDEAWQLLLENQDRWIANRLREQAAARMRVLARRRLRSVYRVEGSNDA